MLLLRWNFFNYKKINRKKEGYESKNEFIITIVHNFEKDMFIEGKGNFDRSKRVIVNRDKLSEKKRRKEGLKIRNKE